MKRILIADDHELVRRGLRQILTDEFPKLQIGEAANARDAVEAVRKQSWDAALLDINMPGRSGLDVLEELKFCKECGANLYTVRQVVLTNEKSTKSLTGTRLGWLRGLQSSEEAVRRQQHSRSRVN